MHKQKHPGPDEITLEAPSIRFNYGLLWDSEIVLVTVGEFIDNKYTGTLGIKEKQFANTAGFYKKVWWRGSDWIPNLATETGIVFPTEKGTSGLDFEGTGILSWYLEKFIRRLTLGGGTEKEAFEHNTRGLFIYGVIILGYGVRFLPLSSRIMANYFKQIPNSMEESGAVIGASWFTVFRRILIPLQGYGIIATWLISFMFCVGELGTTILVYPPGHETLPIALFTIMVNSPINIVSALSVVIVAMTLLPVGIFLVISKYLVKSWRILLM